MNFLLFVALIKQTPQYGFKDLIIFVSGAPEIEDVNGTFFVQQL
jgi:hypothetical protein